MRQVSVSLLPSLIDAADLSGSTAVVIDVLRATSVVATALSHGARRVLACQSIDSAREIAANNDDGDSLLCGERGGLPIEGFDLGNSPAEYSAVAVADKSIVLTTTNGTVALAAVAGAENVITASFLNFSAVIAYLRSHQRVMIVCAGTNGKITGEDVLLAGAMTQQMLSDGFEMADDSTRMSRDYWLHSGASLDDDRSLADAMTDTAGGRNLQRIGFGEDLLRVAQVDRSACVPIRCATEPLELRVH